VSSHTPDSPTSPAVQLLGVSHSYVVGTPVLTAVTLEIAAGERVALLGESGAGKSTLLRCVNALIEPTAGDVLVRGGRVRGLSNRESVQLRRGIGMIFQQFNVHERLSVTSNVLVGRLGYCASLPSLLGYFSAADHGRVSECIRQVGLADFAETRVRNLSGGQKQRVGIARALAQQPHLLLGDEPTANLDLRTAREIVALLCRINTELGTTLILAMHDVVLARQFCTRIVGLRGGRVVFDGPAEQADDDVVERIFY